MPNPVTLNHSKGGQYHITHGCVTLETTVTERYKKFQKDLSDIALSDGKSVEVQFFSLSLLCFKISYILVV